MALILPSEHPAFLPLAAEGLGLIPADAAPARRLRVALINIMPDKIAADRHLLRMLAGSTLAVEPVFLLPAGYESHTTPVAYLRNFYRFWPDAAGENFDAMIVTGAPVEQLEFTDVTYWNTLTPIISMARRHRLPSLHICWGAMAALHLAHGTGKRQLRRKLTGIYQQQGLDRHHPLLAGIGSFFPCPVSRHAGIAAEDLPAGGRVRILAASSESGLCLMDEPAVRATYMLNHLEYEADTLLKEFHRDLLSGRPAMMPRNYLPGDSLAGRPVASWWPAGRRFYRNWLEEAAAIELPRAA